RTSNLIVVCDACHAFNGATARRPWRTRQLEHARVGVALPSMGPRHEGRGEPGRLGRRATVPAHLQWGHGTKAVENPPRLAKQAWQKEPSMGPRHEGRGELARHRRALRGS